MTKLDASLLVFSVLGLVCRYIDQTNLNAAFVSGMKEDLNMFGLQLNYATTCWVVGYVIGQVPGNILLTRFSPHYVVFALEFGWSLMTLCTTWITNYQQLYAIRFFVGLFESAYYPGLHYLIGSWYSKKELGKRASLFQGACALGSLLSLVLQGGVHTTLDGMLGRPGWRWIFIIDAVISFPIAIGAFLLLPDLPEAIKPNWLFSQEEIDLARARLASEGRQGTSKDAYTWAGIKSIFSTWHIYIFTAAYSLYIFMHSKSGCSLSSLRSDVTNSMAFWFKQSPSPKYTVEQINYYPAGIFALQLVTSLFFGWVDDAFLGSRRWPMIVLTNTCHLIVCALLAALPTYAGGTTATGRWVLYYLTGMIEVGAGLIYAWAATVIHTSSEKRSIITATYNSVAFSFNAWLPCE